MLGILKLILKRKASRAVQGVCDPLAAARSAYAAADALYRSAKSRGDKRAMGVAFKTRRDAKTEVLRLEIAR